jgi:hypothetical protein
MVLASRLTPLVLGALVFGASAFGACAPPVVEAPKDFSSALAFAFEHALDDDPAPVAQAVETLNGLLAEQTEREKAFKGRTVAPLTDAIVDGLDEPVRTSEGLSGISMFTPSRHTVDELAGLLTWDDYFEVVKNDYTVYENTWDKDPSCFRKGECQRLQADSHTESNWLGVVDMKTDYNVEFRWLDTAMGRVFLHRFWLKEPAGAPPGFTMNANYYLAITVPDAEGKSAVRIHGNWFAIDFGLLAGSDDVATDTIISNTRKDAENLDKWLDENPTRHLE